MAIHPPQPALSPTAIRNLLPRLSVLLFIALALASRRGVFAFEMRPSPLGEGGLIAGAQAGSGFSGSRALRYRCRCRQRRTLGRR